MNSEGKRRLGSWLRRTAGVACLFCGGWSGGMILAAAHVGADSGREGQWGGRPLGTAVVEVFTGGVLGGLRAPVRDVLWVRAYLAWERRDAASFAAHLRLALTVDPRAIHTWVEGARMTAYDLPRWAHAAGEEEWSAVRREYAARALRLLEEGRAVHPAEPRLLLEAALIWLHQMEDSGRAADLFGAASVMPGAPFYAGRIRGELLWRMERYEEAIEWYRAIHSTLPDGIPEAQKDYVGERIAEMVAVLESGAGGRRTEAPK